MDFISSPATVSGATARTPPSETASARERLVSSDFETFLRMLTTQMQNQDPLNPMEATDFAVQLATFSSVEQAVRTNQLLEGLMSQTTMGGLAGLIGKMVRSEGPIQFDGQALELTLPPVPSADSARLIVRDRFGTIVDATEVSTAGGRFQWHGLGGDGMPMADGSYSFEVIGYRGGLQETSVPVQSFAEVLEVRTDAGGPRLVLRGGQEIAAADVTALRGDTVPR